MFGRRKSNAGKGLSSFLTTVGLALVTVIASQAYPRYQRNQTYTEALNSVRADFSAQKWDLAIQGYKALWANYPDKDKADQFNVAAAHENWATELYNGSLKTRQKFGAAATQFELAAEQRPLSENSLLFLGDCYLEEREFEKLDGLLNEASRRSDVDNKKFDPLRKRMGQLKNAEQQ